MALADIVNEYVDANKPWELAKQEGQDARLHEVCSELINAFTMLTAYLAPVLPKVAENAAKFLNLEAITWANTRETLGEHAINKYEHLMQRVEQKQFDLDFGFEKRIIFSGIAASYPNPAELNGRMVIAVANFAPRKMAKFGVSEGMILSAATAEGKLKLLDVDAGAQPGDKVG